MEPIVKQYPPKEEFINVLSHGIGFIFSIAALVILVISASLTGDVWHIVSFSIYGFSLVLLYLASTLFHSAKNLKLRKRLNVFDHASIFVLIAGTYTPYLLVTLRGPWGWSLFGVVWGFALLGVILKLFFTGRFRLLSSIAYVAMGWIIIIAIKPLIQNLDTGGLVWLLAGGVAYTLGAVLYMLKNMPYNHATFHFFVLIGSACHFISIYYYVM